MPKIIKDIKSIIQTEAKRQLLCDGYSGMTLRSVSSGCGIAIGTIYNYFDSKDTLIASFMLEDWKSALAKMKEGCDKAETPNEAFAGIYRGISDYSKKYAKLFGDSEAVKSAHGIFAMRHSMLLSQIAGLISRICLENALHYTDYLPEFIAQSILHCASEQIDYSVLSKILNQLFDKTPDKPAKLNDN